MAWKTNSSTCDYHQQNRNIFSDNMATEKPDFQMVETHGDDTKRDVHHQPIRTDQDNLGVLAAVKQYKRVAAICMLAAFSASLEGYRECQLHAQDLQWLTRRRGQLERINHLQQGIHPYIVWSRRQNQSWSLCFGLGRYSICRSIYWSSFTSIRYRSIGSKMGHVHHLGYARDCKSASRSSCIDNTTYI